MTIFISWSGETSRAVAEVISEWLPYVIQVAKPWLSQDISKGAKWSSEIADSLEKSQVGIICLTPQNLESTWINFESGALAKTKGANACTFLIGLKPSDIPQPLGQFQHTELNKIDVKKLIDTINGSLDVRVPDNVVTDAFNQHWDKFNKDIENITNNSPKDIVTKRSADEILEEVLTTVRELKRNQYNLNVMARNLGFDGLPRHKGGQIADILRGTSPTILDLTTNPPPSDKDK